MVRPAPSVALSLARALRRALAQATTGTLIAATHGERHFLYLRGGYVAHVFLAGGQEPLGLVLVENGLLSIGELRQSLRRRGNELYGVTLVRDQVLTADQVARGLRLQIARRTARIYALDEVRFTFQPGAIPPHAIATPSALMHPLELLCLAARHPANAHRSLGRVLSQLKSHRVHLGVPLVELQRLAGLRENLTDAEWNALDILTEGCRLAELFSSGLLPAAAAAALVEALIACEVLSIDGYEEPLAPSATPRPAAPEVPLEPIAEIRTELRRGGEPHRLLGVTPGTPPLGLRAAYRRRALLLHPDRWTTGAPRDLPELFAAVAQAYRVLSSRSGESVRTAPPRAAAG
jgi:hypothetical protein